MTTTKGYTVFQRYAHCVARYVRFRRSLPLLNSNRCSLRSPLAQVLASNKVGELSDIIQGEVRMDEKLSSRKFTMALVIHYYKPISRFSSLIAALGNDWECGEERKNVP